MKDRARQFQNETKFDGDLTVSKDNNSVTIYNRSTGEYRITKKVFLRWSVTIVGDKVSADIIVNNNVVDSVETNGNVYRTFVDWIRGSAKQVLVSVPDNSREFHELADALSKAWKSLA
jgi:hypothetical protein